jgi:hypothetical protein
MEDSHGTDVVTFYSIILVFKMLNEMKHGLIVFIFFTVNTFSNSKPENA